MAQQHSKFLSVPFFAAILFLPSLSLAETLILQSGQQVQGKIVYQDLKSVRLDVGLEVPLTYFQDEIKQILPDSIKALAPADQLEEKAVENMDAGQTQQALDLMQQSIQMAPTPMKHLNYGSMLFGQAVFEFKSSDPSKAMAIFQKAEAELTKAARALDPLKEHMFIAQAYFLLGEMYLNAYSNKEKAKAYYSKSLSFYENSSAKAALAALQ